MRCRPVPLIEARQSWGGIEGADYVGLAPCSHPLNRGQIFGIETAKKTDVTSRYESPLRSPWPVHPESPDLLTYRLRNSLIHMVFLKHSTLPTSGTPFAADEVRDVTVCAHTVALPRNNR